MTHDDAPLTPTGRARMVTRHLDDEIPKARMAAEFRVSRMTVTTWMARYLAETEDGLLARPANLHATTADFPPQGLWVSTAATPSGDRADWSEPERLLSGYL